jgi:mRNA interferase MazF
MAGFVKGDVVVLPFPFADLSQTKRRPALVLAPSEDNVVILCQITSQSVRDGHAVALLPSDFESGSLRKPSNIRPNRIFTSDVGIVLYRAGHIQSSKTNEVIQKLVSLLRA